MVIKGKLQAEVCGITQKDKGGVLQFKENCTKEKGRMVIDLLCNKHLDMMIPYLEREDWASFKK